MEYLKKFNIKNVVIIDEELDTNNIKVEKIDSWMQIKTLLLRSKVDEVDAFGELTIPNFLEKLKKVGINPRLLEQIEKKIEYTQVTNTELEKFKSLLKEQDFLKHYFFSDYKKFKKNYSRKSSSLFVVDQYLGIGKDAKSLLPFQHTLRHLLKVIERSNNNHYVLVYTSKPMELGTYDEVIDYLCKKVKLNSIESQKMALYIHFVDKGKTGVTEKILLEAIRKSLKAKYFQLCKNSLNDTINNIQKIFYENDTNQSARHYSYLEEGMQMHEVLESLVINETTKGIADKETVKETQKKINTAIGMYYQKCVDEEELKKRKKEGRFHYEREIFNNISILDKNPVYFQSDISYGDLFQVEINKTKNYYLVVSQACDITIRTKLNDSKEELLLLKININSIDIDDQIYAYFKSEFKTSEVSEKLNKIKNTLSEEAKDKTQITTKAVENKIKNEYRNYIPSTFLKIEEAIYNVELAEKGGTLLKIPYFFLNFSLLNDKGRVYLDNEKLKYENNHHLRFAQSQKILDDFQKFSNIKKSLELKLKNKNNYSDFLNINNLKVSTKTTKTNYKRLGNIGEVLTQQLYTEWYKNQTRPASLFLPTIESF